MDKKIKALDDKIAELQKQKAIAVLEKEIAEIKAGKVVPRIIYQDIVVPIVIQKPYMPSCPQYPQWTCNNGLNENIVNCSAGTLLLKN